MSEIEDSGARILNRVQRPNSNLGNRWRSFFSKPLFPFIIFICILILLIILLMRSGSRITTLNNISVEAKTITAKWNSLDRLINDILLGRAIIDRGGYRSIVRMKSAWTTQTIEFSYSLESLSNTVEKNMGEYSSGKLQEAYYLWQVTSRNLHMAQKTLDTILFEGSTEDSEEAWSNGLLYHYYRYRDTENLSYNNTVSIMNFLNEISILDVSSMEFSRIIDSTGRIITDEVRKQIRRLIFLSATIATLMFINMFILFRMINKAAILEREKKSLKLSARASILETLLVNDNADERVFIETQEIAKDLNLLTPMVLILFRINYQGLPEESHFKVNPKMGKNLFESTLKEILTQHSLSSLVFNNMGNIITLINDSPGDGIDWNECITDIRDKFSKKIVTNVACVYESKLGDYTDIAESYHRILDASWYQFVYGVDSILRTDVIQDHSKKDYEYPLSQESRINDLIKQGKIIEAKHLYDAAIESVIEYSFPTIKMTSLRLVSSILETLQLIVRNHSIPSYDSKLQKGYDISLQETLPKIKQQLFFLVQNITNQVTQLNSNKHENTVTHIQNIIEERFRDPNITLESLADTVHMSPVYIGRIYKKMTSQSISDAINDRRLEEACLALNDTDQTIGYICHNVGFSNETYFYTLFKKKFGVTPSRYRKPGRSS